jgi:hypothetical protein
VTTAVGNLALWHFLILSRPSAVATGNRSGHGTARTTRADRASRSVEPALKRRLARGARSGADHWPTNDLGYGCWPEL